MLWLIKRGPQSPINPHRLNERVCLSSSGLSATDMPSLLRDFTFSMIIRYPRRYRRPGYRQGKDCRQVAGELRTFRGLIE